LELLQTLMRSSQLPAAALAAKMQQQQQRRQARAAAAAVQNKHVLATSAWMIQS
jgi:hypothetical protein